MPVLVDWEASFIAGAAPYVVRRDVNYGGSPLEWTIVMSSVRVPLDVINHAEFTLVPLDPAGGHGPVQQGHLRLVFNSDKMAQLLSLEDSQAGADAGDDDMVFSWEPWRF